MSIFSDNLIFLRKRDNMSQQELADKIGVSRSIVGMYETDKRKPSFEMLEAIADTFNVNLDFLYGHSSSGAASKTFRENLSAILSTADPSDIAAAGIDLDEANLVISGAIPLSFDYAYTICDQLGETVDSMMSKEKLATEGDSELAEITRILWSLSTDNRSKLLELSRLYLDAQRRTPRNE